MRQDVVSDQTLGIQKVASASDLTQTQAVEFENYDTCQSIKIHTLWWTNIAMENAHL